MGVLDLEKRDKDTKTGLKEERGIEMSTTVLPYTRCSLSFALKYLPVKEAEEEERIICEGSRTLVNT